MNLISLILIVIHISIWLTVFALGLRATLSDFTHVLRQPGLLLRSLLAMMIIMPVAAVILVKVMSLPPPIAIALVTLSLAPVPPFLPRKQLKAGGRNAYAVGLLVAISLISMVWLPVAIEIVGVPFGLELHEPVWAIARLMLSMILAPLAVGLLFRRIAPAIAERLQPVAALLGVVLLFASAIPILFTMSPRIAEQIGNGTLVAFGIFILVGLGAGHVLGGPDPEDRTVLAIASASRHPGVAIQLAHLNFPNAHAAAPAILLYLLTVALLTLPYVLWRKRLLSDTAAAPKSARGSPPS